MAQLCGQPGNCQACPPTSCPPPLRERPTAYGPGNSSTAEWTGALPVEDIVFSRPTGGGHPKACDCMVEVLNELQGLREVQRQQLDHLNIGQCRLEAGLETLLEQQRQMSCELQELGAKGIMESESANGTAVRESYFEKAGRATRQTGVGVRPLRSSTKSTVSMDYLTSGVPDVDCVRSSASWNPQQEKVIEPRLVRFVKSNIFDRVSAAILTVNAIFIGVQVDYNFEVNSPFEVDMVDLTFCILFNIELWLRLWANGCREFFCSKDRAWNIFDLCVVLVSSVDTMISTAAIFALPVDSSNTVLGNVSVLRSLRIVRILRVLRIIRLMKFFQGLRMLLMAIGSTIRTAGFAFGLILGIMYIFGILITQLVAEFVKDQKIGGQPLSADEELLFFFGALWRSVFCLFMSITGGIDWKDAAVPLSKVGVLPVCFFLLYVAIMLLCIMNVLLGIFCENAVETAAKDHENVIKQQLQDKTILANLFKGWSESEDGVIRSFEEFKSHLRDNATQKLLRSLGIDYHDAITLFETLDVDHSGDVDLEDFVAGCVDLRGGAKVIHMRRLSALNREVLDRVNYMGTKLAEMEQSKVSQRSWTRQVSQT